MRCAEGAAFHQRLSFGKQSCDGVDPGYFQTFLRCKRRKNSRDSPGYHGFAGAGGTGQKEIVKSGGRDKRRTYDRGLPADIAKIFLGSRLLRFGNGIRFGRRERRIFAELYQLMQMTDACDTDSGDNSALT